MAKKTAYCAVLVALAMIFSYIEAILPIHFGVPGVKIGLANLVIVTGFYYLSPGEVLLISITRMVLSSLLFGNGVSFLYSFAGGMLSFLIMFLLKRTKKFSVIGVSIAGGVSHNIGQICAAAWITQNKAVLYYTPVLIAAGVFTGMLMGILSARVLPVISRGKTGQKKRKPFTRKS